jgi:hypothetical protein
MVQPLGHVPTPEFLADCEAVIEGTLFREEARARSLTLPGQRLLPICFPFTVKGVYSSDRCLSR